MLANFGSGIRLRSWRNPFFSIFKPLRNSRDIINNLSQTLTLSMVTPSAPNNRRPMCPSCSRPTWLCLCIRLKTPILDNSIAITVLQHSLENRHPLNSTRIATLGLKNVNVVWVSDVLSEAHFDIHLLQSNLELGADDSVENHKKREPSQPAAISFTIEKKGVITSLRHVWNENLDLDELLVDRAVNDGVRNGFIVKKMQRSSDHYCVEEFELVVPPGSVLLFPSENSIGIEEIDFNVKNLIVLDGTWAKATKMYKENPWLKLLPHLKLDIDKLSLYGEVRRQPKAGCLSSIESIVYALKGIGEDVEGLDGLLDVFESMVGDQRRCKNERLKAALDT